MGFNITKKTRIKIPTGKLLDLKTEFGFADKDLFEFRIAFQSETGLIKTSIRRGRGTMIYFFKVWDKNKYFLAKIKYGL